MLRRRHAQRGGRRRDRCRSPAGQDRDLLERYLAADLALSEALATEWWLAEVVSDPEFAAFLHWRCRVVADLVADVKAALPAPAGLAVIPTVQRPPAACWLEGSDPAMLARVADALEVPLYQPSAAEAYLSAWDVRRRAGDEAALNFILRPSFPDLANGADTVAAVRRLQALRPAGIAFYNYGHLRLTSLERMAAALAALEAS